MISFGVSDGVAVLGIIGSAIVLLVLFALVAPVVMWAWNRAADVWERKWVSRWR